MNRTTAIGVDVGGSSIKSALVNLAEGRLCSERRSVPTPAQGPPAAMLEAIASLVADIDPTLPAGIAFPSVICGGTVETAANISKAWIGQPLARLAAQQLGRAVTVINDADAAGLAEVRCGAAMGVRGLVMVLTLGTGIGSALFHDGVLVRNSELGHLQVDGMEAEQRASGRVRTEQHLDWDQWTAALNRVLQEYHKLLWPDLIVLCGGVTEEAPRFFDKLECRAELRIGRLRADAGIVGAAMATAS